MKRFRKVIFWCHLVAGTFAGVVIFIMSVTGVLLAYEKQIINWADVRGYQVSRPSEESARLPLSVLAAKAREARGATSAAPSTLTVRAATDAPVSFGFGREGNVFVNPYTGEVLGNGSPATRAFFQKVTDWHRWLGAGGESRAVGRAVTGACNLAFLFIVASGFYLWWPRSLSWKAVRSVAWFRRGLAGRARDFNWHNTVGFWCALPLFVVVLSAVVISYGWAGNLVYRVAGEQPPAPRPPQPQTPAGQGERGATPAPSLEGLDALLARAERQVEGWRSISLQLPPKPDAPAAFTIDRGDGGQPQKRAQLTLDRATGEVVRWEPFESNTAGRRLRSYLRFAHTGEVLGLFGQTVAGLVSLGGAVLVYTGLALAWRRLRAWVARRAQSSRRAGEELAAETAAD